MKRISNLIVKLKNEILLLVENNEDCDKELNGVSSDLLNLVDAINKIQDIYPFIYLSYQLFFVLPVRQGILKSDLEGKTPQVFIRRGGRV